MRFIPKVSLHGSGEVVELSNGSHADFTLMQGSAGLGMGPREISTVALPSGGSLVRHRRGTESEVQVPILLGGSERKRWDLRRKLERLVRGEIEIRVSRPNGVFRSRFGYYKSGLEGSYGAGEDSPNGQKIVLEFLCPDMFWRGEEQAPNFRLSGLRKRFLSERAEPVPTGVENTVKNPSFEDGHNGYLGRGEFDLSITTDRPYAGKQAARLEIDSPPGADMWFANAGASVKPGNLSVGARVRADVGTVFAQMSMNFADADGNYSEQFFVGSPVALGDDYVHVGGELDAPEGTVMGNVFLYVYGDAEDGRPVVGDTIVTDAWAVVQGGGYTFEDYADGDSTYWGWSGERYNSVSVEFEKSSTFQSPFLPVVLSPSTVQGEVVINVGGDAPVYPTWIIDGPGTDLIIENDKGDSIKILADIKDQITITTNPLEQDITSPSMPDGELWESVPTDAVLFPLEPGTQRIKMSMVGAKPNSLVQCLYRENYWAGW